MIPRTFPSTFASNGQQQMVVHFLTSVEGLARWSDYIPVKLAQGGPENSYSGCIDVVAISELTADTQAWKEYIPVYADSSATDAWTVNSVGYIPYNYALFADATMQLDLTNGAALDPRITFSRTTNATLTNSAGLIANAPMNLLTHSEQFDNTAWSKLNTTVTANTVSAPNASTTADTLTASAGAAVHNIQQGGGGSGTPLTISINAKAGTHSFLQLSQGSAGGLFANFDLSTGQIGTVGASATATITDAGNGWYRCTMTFTPGSAANMRVGLVTSATATYTESWTADGTESIFIWGAQLELGSTATTYNPTTIKNLLGFTENFDNAAWTKSNAFVQTNQLLWSQDFTNAAWIKVGATVASSANTLSFPKLNEAILQTATMSATVGTAATFSVVLSGSGTAYIGCFRLGAATYEEDRTLITLTSTPTRYTVSHTMVNAGQTGFGGFISRGADGTATTVTATQAQLVNGTSAGDYKATYASTAAVGYPDIYGQPFAQKLVENTANSLHSLIQPITPITSTPYTGTVYVKAAERAFAFVGVGQSGNINFASIDLSTGAVSVASGSPTVSATSIGNGWFRVSVTVTPISTANLNLEVRVSTDGVWDNRSYTGDGTSGIFIFGAQLSDSASVDPYFYQPVAAPTSTAYYGPRFDYDPVTLAPKGLLIEEQRTQLLLNSSLAGTSLATQNVTVAAVAHTLSFYGTGTVTLSGVSTAGPLVGTGAYPSRATLTFTPTAGTLTLTVTGTVQFAQLEAGAFATSFIPSAASQVTRAADSASMIGNNFARWYNVNEGTLYSEAQYAIGAGTRRVVSINDNTVNNSIQSGSTGTNGYFEIRSSGSIQVSSTNGSFIAGSLFKNAFGFKADDFAFTTNAAVVGTDTSGTVPVVFQMQIGMHAGSNLNGTISRISYFNRRLANSELIGLTS